MGDRNNPIKFGPEWLRNLSREPSAGGTGPNNQNTPPGSMNNTPGSPSPGAGQEARAIIGSSPGAMAALNIGASGGPNPGAVAPTGPMATPTAGIPVVSANAGGPAIASGPPIPGPSTGAIPRYKTNNTVPKVLLAKLREEMLALYDRSEESPDELKQFDILYQPRSKPPFALNSTFEEDVRDNIRGGPPIGAIPTAERYTLGRGGTVGRGGINEARGRSRMPFVRQTSLGRGNNSWHVNNTRMPTYNTGPEEDASLRPWNNGNGGANPNRTTNETAEWTPNKMFRRRQNNNTNWRQPHTRDESDEWRALESQRNRSAAEKWDREWGERPNQERQQSWNSNRRTWMDEAQNNDDNLPEWAVDSAEAGAGTFDSSGAFHGYSNDDSNLPKSQETSFPLARSHTHGSFARSKTAEEGSAEWWASEKAKKLSTKKFDTGDIKFTQTGSTGSGEGANPNCKQSSDDLLDEISSKEEALDPPESPEGNESNSEDTNQNSIFTSQFKDSTFEALMRSDIDLEDSAEDRNNYQAMMMAPNSRMGQPHQHLIPCPIDRQQRNMGLLQMLHVLPPMNQSSDNESREAPDDKLVEKLFDMTLEESKLQTPMIGRLHPSNCVNQRMPNPNMHLQMGNQMMPNHSMPIKGAPTLQMGGMQGMQNVGMPNPMNPPMQNVGMHNSALNSSLALPMGPANNNLVMPMQNVPPPVIPNPGMQARLGFQPGGGMPMLPGANVGNASLFMAPNNQPAMQNNEIPMPNHNSQNNMFPMHPIQHPGSQAPFGSMYGNIPQPHPPITPDSNLVDAWYYEDPEKVIQGPFSSKEMYNWYRAGFFSPSLMVRRACETHLRPLGSYGPVVPFIQLDMLSPFPMSAAFDTRPQQGMGIDDSLWTQPAPAADLIWMQQMDHRNESRINNLPMFFWEPQAASAISSNSLLPEEIAKEMKTEDQILAQLRASQNLPTPPNVSFINDQSPTSSATTTTGGNKPEETFPRNVSATPNLEELQKLIQSETLAPPVSFPPPRSEPEPEPESEDKDEPEETELKEDLLQVEPSPPELPRSVSPTVPAPVQLQQPQVKTSSDQKQPKQTKNDTEKSVKKETNNTKAKNKKAKEEKKEEVPEVKNKEEELPAKVEKRSVESSPTKSKKEEKQTRKEQEKEKKELIKDGFTIVKGVDKTTLKENKKKAEEAKAFAAAAEEAERKKKEEEKLAEEDEKKRKIAEAIKKAQELQQQRQEGITKKAPWSAVATQAVATSKDGLTLAEIQRLEREKKVEQMKEQQQMMQIIAQQQAATLAREQEMQAGLGWAKKKSSNVNVSGQSLAEIQMLSFQAETRAAAAAAAATAAAAAAQALDESPPPAPAPQLPWANAHNGGFWETQANASAKTEKAASTAKPADNNKAKKKVTITAVKKETTPAVEFEAWCTTILTPWSSKIDVPTFVGFLKDIESPYEVKDYVKCYLGESKDSGDFARQFLERRSKLLRVGMVTPSDDLCSPAMAINPRNSNLGDYQEVKGKGKKAKKNKMLKVDARILGFSVTASEDRINVGDIDTV
ncbi:uncharacterized protein Gyf isoform X2 [Epargyreus clarus]|uniref:uncharacterized protein Gyf isoform X2 n=1 Tax=Epargyreus clarus TaxID=520877 RepID=UPI003C30A565